MRTYAQRAGSATKASSRSQASTLERPRIQSRSTTSTLDRPRIPTRPIVGDAHDAFEQEADRIADAVTSARFSGVARPSSAPSRVPVQRTCDGCRAEEEAKVRLTPEPAGGTAKAAVDPAVARRIGSMRGGGSPLSMSDRGFFEPRLGADLSRVRVHSDTAAGETARALKAHAYTVGAHIAFAPGRYAPETPAGRRLLAHELVHTIQQGGGTSPWTQLQREPDNVPYEKTSEAIEYQYKLRSDSIRAAAVAACRTDASACAKLLTMKQVYALYALAQESKGDKAKITAGIAGAAPLLAPRLPPVVPKFPPLRLVPPVAPGPTPAPGPGIGPYVGPAIIVLLLVVAAEQLWSLGQFEEELRRQGFIILEDPLALCIGGCHLPAKPGAPKWDQPPSTKFPPITAGDVSKWLGPTKAPSPQPVPTPKEKSPREKCHETHPSALSCDYTLADRDEVVQDFLLQHGFDLDALGDCTGFSSFGPNTITACDGAPGEVWHCNVKGSKGPVSVFGCLCCDEKGNTSYNWQQPHWSVNLGRP
jgi:Domain of unknown function (DUF4157)